MTGTVISSTVQNNTMSDVATALTDCVTRDGQSPPTQNLPMGGFQITGLGNATTRGAAPNAGQIQDGGLVTLGSVTGTDTITAASTPTITAYAAGQTFDFIAAGTNTTSTVTLNISTLGAKAVTKFGVLSLGPGDIVTGQSVRVRFDGTQFQVISPLSFASAFSFRNKFINGRFDFWRRGTAFAATAAGVLSADRWIVSCGVAGSAIISRVSLTPGDSFSQGRYAMQIAQSVAGTVAPSFQQRIEGVATFAGKTVIISVTASVASGTQVITPVATQSFGTGGSPSTNVLTTFPTFTLTTSEQTFTSSIAIPSISGKSLGTNGDDFLLISCQFPIGVTYTATVVEAQIEEGAAATPFENRPLEVEDGLCQRYLPFFQSSSTNEPIASGQCTSATSAIICFPFKVLPRVPPTGLTAAGGYYTTLANGSSPGTLGGLTFLLASTHSAALTATSPTGLVAGNGTTLFATQLASVLIFNGCEL